mgnify:CR=1 FL=1
MFKIKIILMLLVLAIKPSIITDGTKRMVFHQTYFEKAAPFQFAIDNNNLEARLFTPLAPIP